MLHAHHAQWVVLRLLDLEVREVEVIRGLRYARSISESANARHASMLAPRGHNRIFLLHGKRSANEMESTLDLLFEDI